MIDLKTLRLITQDGLRAFAAGRILDGIAALRTLLPYCATETVIHAEAEGMEENYHHMLDFLRHGGDDQQRGEMQAKMQRQGVKLLSEASRAIRINLKSDLYSKRGQRAGSKEQENTIPPYKDELERVLRAWNGLLTPEETGEVQDDLFDLLWTSPIWTAQDTAFWYDFLLRQRDMVQQHLMGAVFLSTWEYYDAEKIQLLNLLADSECHRTRITAVAYLLLLRLRHKGLAPMMPSLPDSLLSRKGRGLIAKTQHEMLLMRLSEKDLERELKEAEGLTKKVLTTLTPMLTKGAEDKPEPFTPPLEGKGEAIVDSLKSIISLKGRYLKKRLQRGLDINLSKLPLLHSCEYMRRVSHWFLPFDKNHPLFQTVMIDDNGNEKQQLSMLVDLVMDCDVDKLAMIYLASHDKDFSKAVRQLDEQELPEMDDAVIPEYTLRFIMQDLYRFFTHSPLHTQLVNPFREEVTLLDFPELAELFSANDYVKCCGLLFEIEHDKQALALIDNLINREGASVPALLLKGQILIHLQRYREAASSLRSAEILQPDNADILRLLAECYAAQHRFEEELEYLQRLSELFPDDDTYRRLIPMTMIKAGRNEEALQLLFKLDYEMTEGQGAESKGQEDNDEAIVRSIADTALALGKLDIAERYTEKQIDTSSDCQIRLGHIRLLQGDWKGSIDHYEQFINAYCQETRKGADAALSRLSADWQDRQITNLPNCQIVNSSDLLLIHDILQAQADRS